MNPLTNYRIWIIGIGTLIVPLDSTVNVAFPDITRHFAIPAADARLLVVAFILTSISLMLISGRIGDLWGHRRVFQTGLAVSAAALLLVAVSPSYGLLASQHRQRSQDRIACPRQHPGSGAELHRGNRA